MLLLCYSCVKSDTAAVDCVAYALQSRASTDNWYSYCCRDCCAGTYGVVKIHEHTEHKRFTFILNTSAHLSRICNTSNTHTACCTTGGSMIYGTIY